MKSHTMELPRLIVVGEKNIVNFGVFLKKLDGSKKASLVTGGHVRKIIQDKIERSLQKSKIKVGIWQEKMRLVLLQLSNKK